MTGAGHWIYVQIYIYTDSMRRTPRKPPLRAALEAAQRKTRITIYLDGDVLAWFRREVSSTGGSYQKAINLALRDHMAREPLEATLRRVVREELATALGRPLASAYAYEPAALVADRGSEYGPSLTVRRSGRPRRKKGP
jgi:uncharacterized protein (DUF4415 family)